MNKILLDGEVFTQFVPESLPMLIHGEDSSGASLYTMSLAANFLSLGLSIIFLCGYPAVEEEFTKQVGSKYADKARFYTKEKQEEFKKILASENIGDQIILIKNIELFGEDVFDLVAKKPNVIVSGDVNKSSAKSKMLEKKFTTQVYFSPLGDIEMPKLNKYEGFVVSGEYKGKTRLQM